MPAQEKPGKVLGGEWQNSWGKSTDGHGSVWGKDKMTSKVQANSKLTEARWPRELALVDEWQAMSLSLYWNSVLFLSPQVLLCWLWWYSMKDYIILLLFVCFVLISFVLFLLFLRTYLHHFPLSFPSSNPSHVPFLAFLSHNSLQIPHNSGKTWIWQPPSLF